MKRSTPLRIVAIVLTTLCLVAIVSVGARISDGFLSMLALAVSLSVALWAAILSRRDRSRYEQHVRRQVAQESARAERLALATELHDVVSHGLGMITLRASTAPYLTDDAELRKALNEIETISRSATVELRAILSLLREDSRSEAKASPLELADLVEQGRAAGLEIIDTIADVDIRNPAVGRAVAQVVREGLANSARHAGPTRVHLKVERRGDRVRATVRDEGITPGWPSLPGCGAGLQTMRERCEQLGGRLHTRAEAAGFTIAAEIPDPPGHR